MNIERENNVNTNDTNDTITAAKATTWNAIVAHLRANPDQTESQVCYLADAAGVLEAGLAPFASLPAEKTPFLAMSVDLRHDTVHRMFVLAIEAGTIVRTGWCSGAAVYRVVS